MNWATSRLSTVIVGSSWDVMIELVWFAPSSLTFQAEIP